MVEFSSEVDSKLQDILFDPQTSGGLLICIQREDAQNIVDNLIKARIDQAAIIGEVISASQEKILVQWFRIPQHHQKVVRFKMQSLAIYYSDIFVNSKFYEI